MDAKSSLLVVVGLLVIALGYLLFLCTLDLYFVFVAGQERGWYNDLGLFVFTMPFAFGYYSYMKTNRSLVWVAISLLLGIVLAYIEFMWVAIEFHSLIGGEI